MIPPCFGGEKAQPYQIRPSSAFTQELYTPFIGHSVQIQISGSGRVGVVASLESPLSYRIDQFCRNSRISKSQSAFSKHIIYLRQSECRMICPPSQTYVCSGRNRYFNQPNTRIFFTCIDIRRNFIHRGIGSTYFRKSTNLVYKYHRLPVVFFVTDNLSTGDGGNLVTHQKHPFVIAIPEVPKRLLPKIGVFEFLIGGTQSEIF